MSKQKKTAKKVIDEQFINQSENKKENNAPVQKVDLSTYAKSAPFSFDKVNYKLLLLGIGINVLGYVLMIGGATDDPTKFDGDALFSARRITLAPILIVLGFGAIFYSIFKKRSS